MTIPRSCDVLIIGGGMAAGWAAIAAARGGAEVVIVDKGYMGTSGVTATAGPNHWWVPPDPALREAAVAKRHAAGLGLADAAWMERVIDLTWRNLPTLSPHYRFDVDDRGETFFSGVRGPEYMRALRHAAAELGVRILDHHPALELLGQADGTISGAAGHARLERQAWRIAAGAVILATGGCAFRSGLIGSHTNTGDGYLMGAEAGARLSGMEFSISHSLSPAWCSTRTMPYTAARFYDAAGNELDVPAFTDKTQHLLLAKAMLEGPVFADLRDAPAILRERLRRIQPATATPFERKGVKLFDDRFEVKLFGEGTIRGTGGLDIVDEDCRTGVPGLFAVGDAATREPVAGATSGGGAQNSAWALSSGLVAGAAAATEARGRADRSPGSGLGQAGLRPHRAARTIDRADLLDAVQDETLAHDKVFWRTRRSLSDGLTRLDGHWAELLAHGAAEGLDQVALREHAAMLATARWCGSAALTRDETRGLHLRADCPAPRESMARRLKLSGVHRIEARFEDELRAELAA